MKPPDDIVKRAQWTLHAAMEADKPLPYSTHWPVPDDAKALREPMVADWDTRLRAAMFVLQYVFEQETTTPGGDQ